MKNSQHWIIRFPNGRLTAPITTREVKAMIADTALSGDADITPYPGDKWVKVADIPEFYQKIIQELEGTPKKSSKSARKKPDSIKPTDRPATENLPPIPGESETQFEEKDMGDRSSRDDETHIIEPPLKFEQVKPKKTLDYYAKAPTAAASTIINVKNVALVKKESVFKQVFPFVVIFILAAGLLWNLFTPDSTSAQDRVHLLRPHDQTTNPDDVATQKKKAATALAHIEKDTFNDWIAAEKLLVSLVESNSVNTGYRGLLCYTYLELWDYSYKDSEDMKAVDGVAQKTRALNLTSPEGFLCEAVRLQILGKSQDAKATLENLLDSNSQFTMLPLVYYLRGLLLLEDNDPLQARAFLDKAQELWPSWSRPSMLLVKIDLMKNDLNSAVGRLQKILTTHKDHFEAMLELGIVTYKNLKQLSVGENFIQSALKLDNRGPRPMMADGYAIMAEILSERGDKNQAREYAERALRLYPSSSDLKQLVLRLGGSDKVQSQVNQNEDLIYRADQYVRAGDCLSAQAEYKAAFEANPKFGLAAMKAAQCLWQLYQSYEAIDWLKKAIKAEPKLVSAYVLQADYLSQRFDFSNANLVLANAMKIAPQNHEIMRGFAQLELRKNNYAGAINFSLRALKAYDADPANFVILSQAFRNQALVMIPVSKQDIEKKDQYFRDSLRYATKAVELDSTNVEAQTNYAQTLAATGGVDTGIAYLKELIRKFSYTSDYRLALADLLRSEERYAQAKEIYETITTADPKNKKAFLGYGISLKAIGENDKALNAFLSAAVIDPTDAEGTFQAAEINYETGKTKDALNNFLRVRRINPLFPRANIAIAKSYLQMGDLDQALASAQEEKKMNPQLAESYLTIAEIYSQKKQYGECSNEYANALKLRSQDAKIYVKAAACYRLSGSLDVAQDMLDLARQMESGYADIYKEQGALFKIRGDQPAAIKSYRMYLELSPNALDKKEVEQALAQLGG